MYYVYKTTNLLNGMYYIGKHYSIDIQSDQYLGSGLLITRAIKKYGKQNFKREILYALETQQDAYQIQQELVNEDVVKDKHTYNICIGGQGFNSKMAVLKDESGTKYVLREQYKDLVGVTRGYIGITNGVINKNIPMHRLQQFQMLGYYTGRFGRNSNYGKIQIENTGKTKFIDPQEYEQYQPLGWVRKRSHNNGKIAIHKDQETLYINSQDFQLYNSMGYQLSHYRKITNKNKVKLNDTKVQIIVDPSRVQKYLSDGWVLGGLPRPNMIATKNKVRICKGNENKFVSKQQLSHYLQSGWSMGTNFDIYNKGKIAINDGTHIYYVEEYKLEEMIKKGYKKGIINCPVRGRKMINNGIQRKFVLQQNLNQWLQNGWFLGEIPNITQKKRSYTGQKSSQYGLIWIINQETKEVKRWKKTESIPLGWKRGRKL